MPISIKIPVEIALISVALLFVFPVAAFGAEVSISPASTTATLGSQVTVSVNVDNVENLFSVAFDLVFEPAILEFVSAEEGDFLGKDGQMTLLDASINPDNNGNLIIIYSRWEGNVSGSGTLITLTFESLAVGTSFLEFQTTSDSNYLIDPDGNPIGANWDNGLIIIEEPQPIADITPPTIPLNLTATASSSSQIDIAWASSTDPEIQGETLSGLAGYKVYRDGAEIATTTNTFYSDIGLTASTTYSYAVSAYDQAGNESTTSEPVSTTTLAETIPAEVSILPASTTAFVNSTFDVSIDIDNVENLSGAAFDLIFNPDILSFISYQDPVGACLAEIDSGNNSYLVIGCIWEESINGSSTLMTLTFEALSAGTSSLVFLANDESLFNINWEPIPAIWHNAEVTVLEAEPGTDINPPTIPLNLSATVISSSQIDLSWSSSADPEIQGEITSGLAGYKIYRDGTEIATTTEIVYSDIGLTSSTTYSYAVSAYDQAGNESTTSEPVSTTTLAETIPAEVSILPASTTAFVNSTFTVSVDVNNVGNLFGASFYLTFDPDILTFISADKGSFLNQDGASDDLSVSLLRDAQGNVIDPGMLIVGHSRIAVGGIATGVNGSGTLMTLTFEATAIGTSSLIFQRTHLLNPGLGEILSNWNNGAVTVEPPPVCTSFVYSDWGDCQANNTQARIIISSLPAGCVGGTPIVSQSCVYTPPVSYEGGGAAILEPELAISGESIKTIELTENKITIVWATNEPASSQIVYALEGETHTLDLNDEKFGYARITPEYNAPPDVNGTTTHSVVIGGLVPGTIYYYRTVSRGSLAISEEYIFATFLAIPAAETGNEETATEIIEKIETLEIAEETGEEISEKTQEGSQKTEPSEKQVVSEVASETINLPKSLMAAIGILWDKVSQSALLIFSIVSLLLIIGLAIFSKKLKNIIRNLFYNIKK